MKMAEALLATTNLFLGLGLGFLVLLFVRWVEDELRLSTWKSTTLMLMFVGVLVLLINLNGGIIRKEWWF